MNLVDPILFHGRFQPMAPAIILAGDHPPITYAQLARMIHSVSRRAHKQGILPGQVVALLVADQILHIALVLGLTRLGAVTVSGHQLELPSVLSVDVVLSDADLRIGDAAIVKTGWDWLTDDPAPFEAPKAGDVPGARFSRLILTSGTTGEPKAVALTHAQAMTRVMRQPFVFGAKFSECSRVLIDVGLSTVAGFAALFSTLWRGGALFLRSRDPVESLHSLIANRIQAFITAPKGLSDLLELHDKTSRSFEKFEVIVSAGSAMDKRLLARVLTHLCNDLCSIYGSTEYATVAAAPPALLERIEGLAGFIIGGAEVDIVDHDGNVLPVGTEGRIRIRGVSAAEGYVHGTLDQVEVFPHEGSCLGDLGIMSPHGYLLVSGRENSVINLGGDKVSPEKVELAIGDFPGIRDTGVLTLPTPLGIGRLIAAVVWQGSDERDAGHRGLIGFLNGKLPPHAVPRLFVELTTIPRNHMGKIDRPALRQAAIEELRKVKAPEGTEAG
jgi:acyl-coenzyme A synthetase/AMP-(fatty) acid ligase